ncbi:MAG: hypothetical protein WAV31_05025 [Candidatus Moraniibacteriota bacterium]
MHFFYDYIYPLSIFIAVVSILGAPFASLSMFSAFVWIPDGIDEIKYYYKKWRYDKEINYFGKLLVEISKTLVGSIPVIATVITIFFAFGANSYKIDHTPRIQGAYAVIVDVKKSINTDEQNKKIIYEVIIDIKNAGRKEATLIRESWENPSIGDEILVGTKDGNYYYEYFEDCIIADPNRKE